MDQNVRKLITAPNNLKLKCFLYEKALRCWQVCLGFIRKRTNDVLNIKISGPLYIIWAKQSINSKITCRSKNWKIKPELPRYFPKKLTIVQNCLYAFKPWCKCIYQYFCGKSYHWIFTEKSYMGNLNKFAKPNEWIQSGSRHMPLFVISIVIYWVYYTILFGLFWHFWGITFHLLKLFCLNKYH